MPAGFVQTYRAFAYNNAWANDRLLTACAGLSQEDFAAARTGFFPSLQLTLNHIHVIDLFYVDALEGGSLGPEAWENRIPCPSLPELKRAQAAVDRRLIAVCNTLTPRRLDGIVRVNRGVRVQSERRDRLLMHLFQHQIHHRGQAHACSPERRSSRRSSMSFFRAPKLRFGPASLTGSAGPRKRCGGHDSSWAGSVTYDEFNAFCRALPATSYVVQWGGAHVWKVGGKVFAIGGWEESEAGFTFKVTDIAFEMLKAQPGLRPAPYLASRGMSWIQHFAKPGLSDRDLKAYIRQSHRLVGRGLPKKTRRALGIDER